MLEGGAAIAHNYQIVMDREQDADDVTREVLIAVRRTFITPFDRGNIRDLITSMDNTIDQMQKTAKGIKLFDVTEFTPQMKDMADAIVGALAGAIVWQIVTQRLGIPSSSSHALIGGLVGAGLAKAGVSAVVWSGVGKTVAAIFLSPGLGLILALALMLMVSWIFVRLTPYGVDNIFRRVQFVSASLYALGHGGNDAQKTMGIIAVLLYSQGS